MKSNLLETDFLSLYFTNVNIANLGDATGVRGSTVAGSLYLSLHTDYPGEAGTQSTSECAYTNYARKAVARATAQWTVTANTATTDNDNAWPTAGVTAAETAWFVGCGRQVSGANELDYIAPIGSVQGEGTATTADVMTVPGHTLANDERVCLFAVPGKALPAGVTAGTVYYVITVSGDTFSISTTLGGAAVNVTAAGAFIAFEMSGIAIDDGVTPTILAGTINFIEE